MWLLDTKTGALTNSKGSYAILSHVWSPSGEQTFQEVRALIPIPGLSGASAKIKDCCAFARGHGYSRVWIDTCCIDKTSSAELSEAINSMYLWYSEAVVCIVFLEDVDASQDPRNPHSQFRRSRWWRRGWTLQELIAPRAVLFVSRDWEPLGTKRSLADVIEQITGIDRSVLVNDRPLNTISVARRMSWAAGRETTRLEDEAYSLMGLFDIHMPTLYGEGRRAFIRLQEEILRRIPDQSIFAWGLTPHDPTDLGFSETLDPFMEEADNTRLLLADVPAEFSSSSSITSVSFNAIAKEFGQDHAPIPEFTITSYGVRSRLLLIPFKYGSSSVTHVAVLPCRDPSGELLALLLRPQDDEPSSTRFVVGNRRFLQQIRLTSLAKLRSLGALAGDAEMREVYIAYQRSSHSLSSSQRLFNSLPASSSGGGISCPCWVILPVWQIKSLEDSGYTLEADPAGYRNRIIKVDKQVERLTIHYRRDYDRSIEITLFSASSMPNSTGSMRGLGVYLTWAETGYAEEASTVECWADFTKEFCYEGRSVRLSFTPWGNQTFEMNLSIRTISEGVDTTESSDPPGSQHSS